MVNPFELEVKRYWNIGSEVFHIICIVKSGKVIPPCLAELDDNPEKLIRIKSMVVAKSVSGNKNEVTFSIVKPCFESEVLNGATLKNNIR